MLADIEAVSRRQTHYITASFHLLVVHNVLRHPFRRSHLPHCRINITTWVIKLLQILVKVTRVRHLLRDLWLLVVVIRVRNLTSSNAVNKL